MSGPYASAFSLRAFTDQIGGNEGVEIGRYESFAWRKRVFLCEILGAPELRDLRPSPRNLFLVEIVQVRKLGLFRIHDEIRRGLSAVVRIERPRQEDRQELALPSLGFPPLKMEIVVAVGRGLDDDLGVIEFRDRLHQRRHLQRKIRPGPASDACSNCAVAERPVPSLVATLTM